MTFKVNNEEFSTGDLVRCTWELPDTLTPLKSHFEWDKANKVTQDAPDLRSPGEVLQRRPTPAENYLVRFACGSELVFGSAWLEPLSALEQLAWGAE